jgi:hypothetical protein
MCPLQGQRLWGAAGQVAAAAGSAAGPAPPLWLRGQQPEAAPGLLHQAGRAPGAGLLQQPAQQQRSSCSGAGRAASAAASHCEGEGALRGWGPDTAAATEGAWEA